MLMKQADPLDIEIPEDHVIVLIQKIRDGRRFRVFKNLGEAGKNAEDREDYAVVVPNSLLGSSEEMIRYAEQADEDQRIEIGQILGKEADRG